MDPGGYQYSPPMHGLPPDLLPDFSCDGSSLSSFSNSNYQVSPYADGLPRTHADQQMPNTWPPMSAYNYNLTNSVSMLNAQAPVEWTQSHSSNNFGDHSMNGYVSYSGNNSQNHHDGVVGSDHSAVIPRTTSWSESYKTSMLNDINITPSVYESSYTTEPIAGGSKAYNMQDNQQRDFARMSLSPKIENDSFDNGSFSFDRAPPSRLQASENSDESLPSSREMTGVEVEDHGADEPYAKLIYRALMSVENHAMVLQEIYQWFRENTNKGSSDTKGWMNSIRHNLSMNAAFQKTERRISGDETKKSTEWVLEDFAIKDGVQSTTRYRKGTGSKKFVRSENPAAARQTSGRKGGICSSKAKLQRQRFRDDRSDLRRNTSRVDTGIRSQFTLDGRAPQIMARQISPVTPNADNFPSSSPYFMPKEEPAYDDLCGLPEGIHGLEDLAVFPDDSPVFSNSSNIPPYHSSHSILNHY